jgi:hypothetical protein
VSAVRCRIDTGVFEDLPDGRGGDLHPEDEQFAVDAPVRHGRDLGEFRVADPTGVVLSQVFDAYSAAPPV